jgi:hypothetical protein
LDILPLQKDSFCYFKKNTMKKLYILVLFHLSAIMAGFSQPPRVTAAFTPGNLVVFRIGNGSGLLTADATPVFLDEFTPSGTLVQTIPMPVSVSGSNRILTVSGTLSEGWLTLSTNGQFLTLLGYNAPVGTVNVAATTSATNERVVGLVDYNGVINTSTALTDLGSTGSVRCAITTDGTNIWAVAQGAVGTGTEGIRYTTVGSTTSTQVQSSSGIRVLNITGGQLYATNTAGSGRIVTVGTGLPTTPGQVLTTLPGTPAVGGGPFSFTFADLNPGVAGVDVLYVADETATALRKYSFDGATWTLNGTIGVNTDDYRGLTSTVSGTTVTLFATRLRLATGGGELVSIVDASGWNGAFAGTPTILATATANTAFAGVALAPSAPCTAPSINVQPSSLSICPNNTTILSVSAIGSATLNYQWYQGTAPDVSTPVGTNSNSFTTPALTSATNYWVRVTNGCGTTNSNTATVGIYTSATWTGASDNNYNVASNWNTNCVPTVTMDIIIPFGSPTITGSSNSVRSVTLQAGAILNLNNGAILHIKGNFINNGTIVSGGAPTTGKTIFDGTVTQNMSGAGVFSYVEISNSINVFVLSSMSAKSVYTLPGGKFNVNPGAILTITQ